MPYTAEDCSELCWPHGSLYLPEDHQNHVQCQDRGCSCDCHFTGRVA